MKHCLQFFSHFLCGYFGLASYRIILTNVDLFLVEVTAGYLIGSLIAKKLSMVRLYSYVKQFVLCMNRMSTTFCMCWYDYRYQCH